MIWEHQRTHERNHWNKCLSNKINHLLSLNHSNLMKKKRLFSYAKKLGAVLYEDPLPIPVPGTQRIRQPGTECAPAILLSLGQSGEVKATWLPLVQFPCFHKALLWPHHMSTE